MRQFAQFAGIDWSGAAPERPGGIAVAQCGRGREAPVMHRRKRRWSREEVLHLLEFWAKDRLDILVGVDFSPGLPFADAGAFFPQWSESPRDAKALWAFVDHLSAESPHYGVSELLVHPEVSRYFRHPGGRQGDRFGGGRGRLRATEAASVKLGASPSSCFNLVGAAQVGKSSLTGMRILHRLRGVVPVWPFDPIPAHGPMIVEIYPRIAQLAVGRAAAKIKNDDDLSAALGQLGGDGVGPNHTFDQNEIDALLSAAWMRRVAGTAELWNPAGLTQEIRDTEGWIFGVP